MKLIKKILKWFGITLLVLIALLILIPIIFKDELKQMVIDEVNKSLTAELALEDFDLTFISTFPNMTVELMGAKLTGLNEFEGVTLADIKNIKAHVGFWDVVTGDQIEIDQVHITDASVDILVLENGLANWDIVKPDSLMTKEELAEPSSFTLSLNEYSINNGTIKYDDRAADMFAEITNLNHSGSGDLTEDVVDFVTSTTMDKLTFEMSSIGYLSEVKTDAAITLLMEFKENSSKFTLKENEIKLNAVTFSIDGFYEMRENDSEMDLKLDASKTEFKDFLSLIPAFYHSGYEKMVSGGKLAINGAVKGVMDEENLPGWDFNLDVENGTVNYPNLPGKITNIQVDAGSTFEGGSNLDKMKVDVSKFHANLSKNSIDANLSLRNLMSDPYVKSKILAFVDLSTIKDFVPLGEGESYNGILDADVDIEGRMSDLDKGDYEAFRAEGILELSKVRYASESISDDVDINHVKFTFSPENLTLNELNAVMGKSDFAMSGKVDNYFGYMLRNEVLKGDFNFNSNYLDLESFMPESEESSESTAETSTSEEPLLIPENIDFELLTSVGKTQYNGVDFENVKGIVHIKEEVLTLDDLSMNTMGGRVSLNGNYDSHDHEKPKMKFGYRLNEVDIQQLVKNFLTVEKLAPITKYAYGNISSNFDMTTDLTTSLEPIMASISSIGDISSNSLTIKGFKTLEKLESVTKLKNISNQTLKSFKTFFKVEDGKVSTSPFDIKLGKISSEVSGYSTLDQQMDYKMKMSIPKEELPKEVVKEVDKILKQANAAIPFVKLNELPAVIPVNVKMIGKTTDPKITTDMKEAIMNAIGVEGNIVDQVTETIKDTVTQIINQQVDNAKAEIEKQKKKIMDDARKEAEKVKAECNKQAENLWEEAYKQADDGVKAAGSNPVKKRLAEEAAKIAKKEADKQYDKAKGECQKQSDNIMSKAQSEADKLGN